MSAAHVAGAAALVLDATPASDPPRCRTCSSSRATAAGPIGKDNAGLGSPRPGPGQRTGAPTGQPLQRPEPVRAPPRHPDGVDPLASGATRQVQIAGTNGVPANATAVVLSVVAVQPTAAGYLTAFPVGAAAPSPPA